MNCETGLRDGSFDVVLLYDTLQDSSDPGRIFQGRHRVLKLKGTLSITDHHISEVEIVS